MPVPSNISAQTPLALPPQIYVESRYASFNIQGQGNTTGLGNALAFGEYHAITTSLFRLSLGSQLETPTGNHDRGLGANHFMAIPYANLCLSLDAWRFAVQAGYQQTLASHSHATYECRPVCQSAC